MFITAAVLAATITLTAPDNGANYDTHTPCVNEFLSHPAERSEPQSAASLDLRDHRAERIRMRFEQKRVFAVRPAERNENAALYCLFRGEAEGAKRLRHPIRRLLRKARGTVDPDQLQCFLRGIFRIASFHSIRLRGDYLPKLSFSATARLKTRCSAEESLLSMQK